MALFGIKKTNKKDKVKTPDTEAKSATGEKQSLSMQDLYNPPVEVTKVTSSKTSGSKTVLKVKSSGVSRANQVLIKPVITEKATHLNAINKYVFVVAGQANKISVAQAVEAVYGVKPRRVNIMNVSGKKVVRRNIKGRRNDWRKAIVTLKKGETIKIYEGV